MSELVSVIVPCYNVQKYVQETIESVLSQTYSPIELILVDDGSTDETFAVLNKYASERVHVISQDNGGACRARNRGLEKAKGKYIQYIDGDDAISKDKIAAQIQLLDKAENFIAVCNTVFFNDGDDHLSILPKDESRFLFNTNDPVDFLVNLYGGYGEGSMVQTNAWLTPRKIIDAIGPWNEEILQDQDGEYFCRAVLASKGIVYSPNGISFYRKHPGGGSIISRRGYAVKKSYLNALNLKAGYLLGRTDSIAAKRALSRLYMGFAVINYPYYKDLVVQALLKVDELGVEVVLPIIGGRVIETLKKILGWRVARYISFAANTYIRKKCVIQENIC